jgi:PAS domain S-box-containing protein
MSELTIAATVFESNVGMCISDSENTILRVNHAFTDITGYTAEEAIGQKPNFLSSGRQGNNFYILMWDSIKSIGTWQGELWNRRKSGEVYPQYLTITVARIGGDEFVLLLEGLGEHPLEAATRAEIIGSKILAALNQPYQLDVHEYRNSPSIGIALFNGYEHKLEDLLKHADIAMYDAKKAGRNALRFFDPLMQETINIKADMERDLHNAIAQQQLHLYYQVQVDSRGRPWGAEALIRWIHPERGIVAPIHFIPLAEETELILPIGLWVLKTACAQLKAWEASPLTRELTLSINVSAKQFNQPEFVTQVQTIIQRYAITPQLLKLELTESILVDNITRIIATMNALERISIRFSLDDFGTGYSSLQYLKKLPLYQLKIDQSFIRDIAIDSSDEAIVLTIISMAYSLSLAVIAEGVETEEQRQILLDNGCTHFQGYLFGKPVPIELFEAALIITATK